MVVLFISVSQFVHAPLGYRCRLRRSKSGKGWWLMAVQTLSPLFRKLFFFLLPFLCITSFFFFFKLQAFFFKPFFIYLYIYIHTHKDYQIVLRLWNNIIYRFLTYMWLNFRWTFFLHGSTSLIVGINFLSASAIIYSTSH